MKFKVTLYKEGNEDAKFSLFSFAHDERGAVDRILARYPKFGTYIVDSIEKIK